MPTLCEVNGVDRTGRIKKGSVRITKAINGRDQFSCVFLSKSAASIYRPTEGEELTYEIDGSLPAGFGGTIVSVEETAVRDPNVAWACKVDAIGFTEWLDLVMVDDVWPANGLWDRVYHYHLNYLSPRFGTTYGGPTSGGPSLPASTYSLRKLSDVLVEMTNITGYFGNIGGDKLLAFGTPGGVSAPVVLDENNGGLSNGSAQSVTRRKKRLTWYTRGYMKVSAPEGTAQDAAFTVTNEVHTSTGVVGEFPLRRRPVVVAPTQVSINGAAAITLPSSGYSYDASRKAIIKTLPYPTAGTTITVLSYGTKWPVTIVYDDQKTQTREMILADAAPETTLTQADGILKYHVQFSTENPPQEVDVRTREPGFYVGMAVTLNFPVRNVTGTHWVVSIDITDDPKVRPSVAKRHRYVLHCVAGSSLVNPWQADLRAKLGGGGAAGVSHIPTGSVTPSTSGGMLAGTYTLQGSRNVAGVMSTSAVGIGNGIMLNGDAIPAGATVRFRALVRTDNGSTTVTARLRRLTGTPADVASVSSTSTAWTEPAPVTFSPISGWHAYELQILGSDANNAVYALGAVDVLT